MKGSLRIVLGLLLLSALGIARQAEATDLTLRDGRVLQGKLVPLPGIAEKPDLTGEAILVVYMLDDDLRRTYVSKHQTTQVGPGAGGEVPERFKITQKLAHVKNYVSSVGQLYDIQPFSEFGVRRLKMATAKGEVDVVQAITEITPTYTKVEGVTHTWEMRIATSSIPTETLAKILSHYTKADDLDQRKKVVRLYVQCGRFEEAARELDEALKSFSANPEAKKQLEPVLQQIREASGRQVLDELKLRRDAGQHAAVLTLLKNFPADGPAGETIQQVREMIRDYEAQEAAKEKTLKTFKALAAKLQDKYLTDRIHQVAEEIKAELNRDTLPRLAAFREMADDETMKPEERLALAISGWLVDSKGATPKISTALSMVSVRSQIVKYFAAGDKLARAQTLNFQSEEAATPELVTRVLANMKPPVVTEPQGDDPAQAIELEVPGAGTSPAVRYLVQLPPEYNPYRKYPAIVSLHGAGSTPEMQIEWWAGPIAKGGWRAGHASRRGYIVIAPAWAAEHQTRYQYSAREHAAVLDSLRDACLRFSIDTDRVYLSGHSLGADAAWDIGLAHPDLWAGVMPIAGKGDRYCNYYWENAKLVPFYFVCGELDGPRSVAANARDWNRYLKTNGYNAELKTNGFNVTVVEFRGRGHEHFSDEVLRLFDWMGRQRRNLFPREFKVAAMRSWDNRFWWVEVHQYPQRAMIDPEEWPASRRNLLPVHTEASIKKTETIYVKPGGAQTILWLSPEMVDLKRRLNITIGGTKVPNTNEITPQVSTILEDVRARGDRLHPFWAKIEVGGRSTASN